MPDVGETWSFVDSAVASRVDAVVIATGPSIIRLVDRFGRRLSFPTTSWPHAWRLEHPPPTPPVRCHQCAQTAYFRFLEEDGTFTWACEDHVPLGTRSHLPGDPRDLAQAQRHCPRCDSTRVASLPRMELPHRRSTTRAHCEACAAQWSALPSHGLSDDGARLATDLRHLVGSGSSEIRVGFTAYRSLCRAMNIGDIAHLSGVPVRMDPTLGELLTMVFFREPSSVVEDPSPPVDPVFLDTGFCTRFAPLTIDVGSSWRKRSPDGHGGVTCTVVLADSEVVIYDSADGCRAGIAPDTFQARWAPNTESTPPRQTSVWAHRETSRLVQVVETTAVQATHDQVQYVTELGQRESTPRRTFLRLYRELPTPPEDHLWHLEGELFAVGRDGSLVVPQPQWPRRKALPDSLEASRLYAACQAVTLSDLWGPLRSEAQWINKSDPRDVVGIVDIGLVDATPSRFVRYRTPDGPVQYEELQAFLQRYQHAPASPLCQVGETWVHRSDNQRQFTIQKVDPTAMFATVRWRDGATLVLSFEGLVAAYRKLEVRTYWEILDREEPD